MRDTDRPTADITHTTLSVIVLLLLITSTFWVLSPFLMPILWASIISVATWPFILKLEAALGNRRGLAVAMMTATILLIVFVPVLLALATIVSSAQGLTAEIQSLQSIALPGPPSWLQGVPFVGEKISTEWRTIAALGPDERSAALTPYLQTVLQWFVARAGSVGSMLLQFLLTTIITAIMLANGEIVRDGILRFAERLAGRQGYDVAVLAGRAIRGVVLGVVVTALIQAAIGAIGLVVSGIPAAALLTAVTLFLCLAQLGPWLVLGPAVGWLYLVGARRPGDGASRLHRDLGHHRQLHSSRAHQAGRQPSAPAHLRGCHRGPDCIGHHRSFRRTGRADRHLHAVEGVGIGRRDAAERCHGLAPKRFVTEPPWIQ